MRKIIVAQFLSVDGVMEAPEKWSFAYQNEEVGQVIGGNMAESDAMLLGRKTYENFEASFSGQTGGFADYLNHVKKYVVSNTLKSANWNNSTLVKGDVAAALATIKQEPGKDIIINGSGALCQSLMKHGLVDEFSLLVAPLVLGSGLRLFPADADLKLNLITSKALSTGVVYLHYAVAR